MKFHLNHTIILILTVCCCINANAAIDSLPPCIKNITTSKLNSFTEYDYKGKKLFSFTIVTKYYDSLASIRYYDSNCKLFCTWIRGGIMGSKMIPYKIEKGKIITLKVTKFILFWWHNVNGKFSRTQFRPVLLWLHGLTPQLPRE